MCRKVAFVCLLICFFGNSIAQINSNYRLEIDSMSSVLFKLIIENKDYSPNIVLNEVLSIHKSALMYNRLKPKCGFYENAREYLSNCDSSFINSQINDTAIFQLQIIFSKFRYMNIIVNPDDSPGGYCVFSKPIFSLDLKTAIVRFNFFIGLDFVRAKHVIYRIENGAIKEVKTFCVLTG